MGLEATERDILEQGLEPTPWRWLETGILTVGPVAVGLLLRPSDPLFVQSDFPWLALAPLMVGLRYGFAHGFAGALFIALALALGHRLDLDGVEKLPGARIVGTLVVGMLAGEFSDRWVRRLQRLRVVGRYRQQRLEEFSRAYHLLKVSHDRLEERMAGNVSSLRGALLTLRRTLSEGRATELRDVGDAIMDLFAEHGWVQVAGLHEVTPRGEFQPEPVAELGAAGRVGADLPLLSRVLETRALVTVRELPESSGPLACVPLEDVDGQLLGIVVIHEMPFVAFTEEHLHLLVVLGGHCADILLSALQARDVDDPAEQDFLLRLRRAH
ncbi:MAG: GAF domain-containing protein, partial [Myxococcota bacterium]